MPGNAERPRGDNPDRPPYFGYEVSEIGNTDIGDVGELGPDGPMPPKDFSVADRLRNSSRIHDAQGKRDETG